MSRRLVLLRHGRTAWNAQERAQGHLDVELDEVGRRQAAEVAPVVAAFQPAMLWTSDLVRARQTCRPLELATGLTARADPRLREYDVGSRQGMTSAQFETAFPEAYAAWRAGHERPVVPGAETASEVAARMVPALHEALAGLEDGETGVVVTHGACLKVALLGLLGWPQSQAATLRGVANCGFSTVTERAGVLRLEAYNQQVSTLSRALPGGRADFASGPAVG